jgi:hypothetical protein
VAAHHLVPLLLSRAVQPDMLVVMDRGRVSAAGRSTLVHQRQSQVLACLKVTHSTHAEHVLSDGRSLVTVHPVGVPEVLMCVIASCLEPQTAERLADFPSSQMSTHADLHYLHRWVTNCARFAVRSGP